MAGVLEVLEPLGKDMQGDPRQLGRLTILAAGVVVLVPPEEAQLEAPVTVVTVVTVFSLLLLVLLLIEPEVAEVVLTLELLIAALEVSGAEEIRPVAMVTQEP
jgi:hypothetical protein